MECLKKVYKVNYLQSKLPDMPIEEMVRIEDKDDLTDCPIPSRNYKIPRALLPSLSHHTH
jgi:hypothetical protein